VYLFLSNFNNQRVIEKKNKQKTINAINTKILSICEIIKRSLVNNALRLQKQQMLQRGTGQACITSYCKNGFVARFYSLLSLAILLHYCIVYSAIQPIKAASMLNRISCQLKVARRMPRGVVLLLSGCYYVLWDAWDASHLILEIIGTMCTWSPPTFFSWLSFFRWSLWEAYSASAHLAEYNGRRKEE